VFISLEGIDGAGKTTTAAMLVDMLRADGIQVTFAKHNATDTTDPYVAAYLADMRKLQLSSDRGPYYQLGEPHWALIRASYYALVDHCVVTPALEAGNLVVADGWYYKFIARIMAGRAENHPDFARVEQLLAIFAPIRVPGSVFMLDVPPHLAARRKQAFNPGELGPQNFGVEDHSRAFTRYQSSVREHLVAMSQIQLWNVLDGRDKSVRGIANAIRSHLDLIMA
jgi:dTMP kinase